MGAMLVMLLIFAIMFLHIIVTAKVFWRKLSPVEDRMGLIMELPPYHKPRWGNLLRNTLVRAWDVFKKAFVVVVVVASVFWGLSHSASGDLSESILYKFGTSIEPVTKFFGMGWQTFIAFVSSMVAKEAVLGVLFSGAGSIWDATAKRCCGCQHRSSHRSDDFQAGSSGVYHYRDLQCSLPDGTEFHTA